MTSKSVDRVVEAIDRGLLEHDHQRNELAPGEEDLRIIEFAQAMGGHFEPWDVAGEPPGFGDEETGPINAAGYRLILELFQARDPEGFAAWADGFMETMRRIGAAFEEVARAVFDAYGVTIEELYQEDTNGHDQ